jgi:hypothetical protein
LLAYGNNRHQQQGDINSRNQEKGDNPVNHSFSPFGAPHLYESRFILPLLQCAGNLFERRLRFPFQKQRPYHIGLSYDINILAEYEQVSMFKINYMDISKVKHLPSRLVRQPPEALPAGRSVALAAQ